MNLTEIVGRHKALDIFFSSKCNMNCSYCYIPKTEGLNKVNNEIIESINGGKMIQTIINTCDREALEAIGLWGAEPTINSKHLDKLLSDLFTEFKNINLVNFSTNALLGEKPIIEMIYAIDRNLSKLNDPDKFVADIQISLDGPAWITDASRHPGATEKIIATYRKLVETFTKTTDFVSLKYIKIHFKPTIDLNAMKIMNADISKYEEWFLFFEKLYDTYYDIPKDERGVVGEMMLTLPTVVTPGYHTSEDGKEFAKYIRLSKEIPRDKFKYYEGKYLFTQPASAIKNHIFYNSTIAADSASLTCGGGDASYAVDHTGKAYPCHRLFSVNHYLTNGISKTLSKTVVANSDDDIDKMRLAYIMRGIHDFPFTRYAYITAAVKTLAMVGQADKLYLKDDNMCTLLAIAMNSTYCHAGNTEETTSAHALMLSQIRLYANGGLQEILKLIKEDWRI